jgi:hypothetical protein
MNKKLRVWWIPQVPGKEFHVDVSSVEEGCKVMDILSRYDEFQYKNNIKPDYSNAGGINQWEEDSDGEGNPGWTSWYDEETGDDDPYSFIAAGERE